MVWYRHTGVWCRRYDVDTLPDHYLPGPAHMTRLDPVCARDSFGASPCALFRGRAWILRGSPCCLPRAIFTCIHICISHIYFGHDADTQGMDTDAHRRMWIGSRSFVLGSRSRVCAGRNVDSDDCAGLAIYLDVYVHWCVPCSLSATRHIHIYTYVHIYIYIFMNTYIYTYMH
jgi:hypothetical protein